MALTWTVKKTATVLRQNLTWFGVAVSVVISSTASLLFFRLFWHEQQSLSLDSLKPTGRRTQINLPTRHSLRIDFILSLHSRTRPIYSNTKVLTNILDYKKPLKKTKVQKFEPRSKIQKERREARSAIFLQLP